MSSRLLSAAKPVLRTSANAAAKDWAPNGGRASTGSAGAGDAVDGRRWTNMLLRPEQARPAEEKSMPASLSVLADMNEPDTAVGHA